MKIKNVCYIPFTTETFLPVTVESIKEHRTAIDPKRLIAVESEILRFVHDIVGNQKFDVKRVRLLLETEDNHSFVVDANGFMRKDKSIASFVIRPSSFIRLFETMNFLTKDSQFFRR